MFAAQDLKMGQLNALVKRLGGSGVVRGILQGSIQATLTSSATLVAREEVALGPASLSKEGHESSLFDQLTRFPLGVETESQSSLTEWLSSVPLPAHLSLGSTAFASFLMFKEADDVEVRSALPKGYLFEDLVVFLVRLRQLIDLQQRGEEGEGPLLIAFGPANFFYVQVGGEVVTFRLARLSKVWNLSIRKPGNISYRAGSKVFSASL